MYLQEMLLSLTNESLKWGLKINKKKVMVFSKNKIPPVCNLYLDNEKLDEVTELDYLGSMLTSDARCNKKIRRWIAMAKKSFTDKNAFWQILKFPLKPRKDLLKATSGQSCCTAVSRGCWTVRKRKGWNLLKCGFTAEC